MTTVIRDTLLVAILVSMNAVVVTRHAQAQTGCSSQETQVIQSYTQRSVQAAFSGNYQIAIQLGQQLQSQLSPACLSVLNQMQQPQVYPNQGGGAYPDMPRNIYQDGGNIYAPGLGGCDARDCFVYGQ
jgi:hypothetical protein